MNNSVLSKFITPVSLSIKFGLMSKVLPTSGNLVYEYNPFRNYRLAERKYYFREKFFSISELLEEIEALNKVFHLDDGQEIALCIPIKDSKFTIGEKTYTIERSQSPRKDTICCEGLCIPIKDSKFTIGEKTYTLVETVNDFTEASLLNWNLFKLSDVLPKGIKKDEEFPILYDKNQLIDFDTDELSFNLHNPVDILPQWSYDGSVNLIINDGKNAPKLINSRFSPLGRNTYLIVDRKGDNDTNIYDLGKQFQSDTSLYKTYIGIPKLEFIEVFQNGNLPIGNYHFYFRYADADGNETDFIAESGLVSIFKGSQYGNISSGFREESSYKSVLFILSNIDPSYLYVNVYYSRSTSDVLENATVRAFKINQKFLVNNLQICSICITGYEDKTEILLVDLNPSYQIANNVQTLTICLNRLFFGNILDNNIDYSELLDLSLRFVANPDVSKNYNPVPHTYGCTIKDTYADPKFIYDYTGYLNHEIYRLGIVYIMNNGNLSPVFNIRGMYFDRVDQNYTDIPVYDTNNETRIHITYNEDTGIIYKTLDLIDKDDKANDTVSFESLENVFGIIRMGIGGDSELNKIIGIKITPLHRDDLFKALKEYDIKGYFFVRLKRIPLRLCQAFTIGIDGVSNTPLLPTSESVIMSSSSKPDSENFFIAERFISDDKMLVHNFDQHLYGVNWKNVHKYGAICPEYDINSSYYNSLFCGEEYIVELNTDSIPLLLDPVEERHFYIDDVEYILNKPSYTTRILGVEDNVKLLELNNDLFSSRAGEAEEAFRYEYINSELKSSDSSNLVRGSFGPYIAFDGFKVAGTLVSIYLKDYISMDRISLFRLRKNDKSSYYSISERYSITDNYDNYLLYRGDSYICTFTHRVNRNFLDPSAPINDKIVDENCWKENFEISDGVLKIENFEKINLGDVNAVQLGMWVTFPLISSVNLNIRAYDDSVVDEISLTGHPRTFYPNTSINTGGAYKVPEALCYNKGLDKSLSERWNYEIPLVPAIKNDFTNRISYSDIYVNDAFLNNFRVFQSTHYRDYPKTYGQITKLVELRSNLLCVFEHGVALIPVNERTVAGEGSGGEVYINTPNVLPENPKIISDTFGSQWKDSIIKTSKGVYGVDTVGKKIWRTNGDDFEYISDFRVQEFLNRNISLTERELEPIIGIRNVKTHYNKFKGDVMFTFYDNLYGFEEKIWNLCWNENLQKWVTFYSWVPSYSENIYNQYFSFDRNTSKWVTKLGVSKYGNDFSDGVTLDSVIIEDDEWKADLHLSNRNLPVGTGVKSSVEFELVRDNYKNYELFEIKVTYSFLDSTGKRIRSNTSYTISEWENFKKTEAYKDINGLESIYFLKLKDTTTVKSLESELYERNPDGSIKKDDERGVRIYLDRDKQINPDKIVRLLNIKAKIKVSYDNPKGNTALGEAYASGYNNKTFVDLGYYESVVAVIPKYNMLFLTTDFWKHGQAGIIDIADKIAPTYWYGKQHPFEFEFVVADNPLLHKIFDNLQIISNKAAPESFHYEIVGECYDFAKDKKNMYIRQEATKELYLFNGSDIVYNPDYKTLNSEPRLMSGLVTTKYDKSTIFPLYYRREDTINEIEDHYHLYGHKDTYSNSDKNFSALSGAEVVRYSNLGEYRIWNHAKAVDIHDFLKGGRMRGNMQYKEDKWDIQINPLNLVQRNESLDEWTNVFGNGMEKIVPAECNLFIPPDELYRKDEKGEYILDENGNKILNPASLPSDWERNVISWGISDKLNKEVKLKDKYIKIRIRYSGKDLAVISAIKTLYSINYA